MSLRRSITLLASILIVSGCASPGADLVPVPPDPATVAVSGNGDASMRLRVANEGTVPLDASPVVVEYFLHSITVATEIQDGGPLEPGTMSTFLEFPVPRECVDGGCSFRVSVDPERRLQAENRSNNEAVGHCQGRSTTTYTPESGLSKPQVQ
jgi:hypothetical protein